MIPDGDQQTNDGATRIKNVDKSNKFVNFLEETLIDYNVMMMVLKQ